MGDKVPKLGECILTYGESEKEGELSGASE